GFPGAEEKAGHEERRKSGYGPCQRCEPGPPQNDSQQNPSRSNPIGQQAAVYLKQAIGDRKSADHPSPLARRQVQLMLHPGARDRDAQAVEEHDRHEKEEEREYTISI